MFKDSIKTFLEAVGRDRFQSDLKKSPQTVSRAVSKGLMPAHWYRDVRDWCEANGLREFFDENLFDWAPHKDKRRHEARRQSFGERQAGE